MSDFEMPDWDAPRSIRLAAYERLNAVKLTIEQLEEGYAIFRKFIEWPAKPRYEERRLAAIKLFCEREGLSPPDVAAHAIMVRGEAFHTWWSGGVDPRVECPEYYPRIATDPIDLALMHLDYEEEDEKA